MSEPELSVSGPSQFRIPKAWQQQIDLGTEFGIRAKAVIEKRATSGSRNHAILEVSRIGTRLIEAIETETGQNIRCGECRRYLKSLNNTTEHDVEAIIQKLYAEIEWPREWREKQVDIRATIRGIVESAMMQGPS